MSAQHNKKWRCCCDRMVILITIAIRCSNTATYPHERCDSNGQNVFMCPGRGGMQSAYSVALTYGHVSHECALRSYIRCRRRCTAQYTFVAGAAYTFERVCVSRDVAQHGRHLGTIFHMARSCVSVCVWCACEPGTFVLCLFHAHIVRVPIAFAQPDCIVSALVAGGGTAIHVYGGIKSECRQHC